MNLHLKAACVQVNAGSEILPNLAIAGELIREARGQGAELIALPENVSLMVADRAQLMARVKPEDEHPAVSFFRNMAVETGAWIISGSIAVALRDKDDDRLANRCYLFDPAGNIVARYDKIHLYDADPCAGEVYRESKNYRPGNKATIAKTPWGKLGITICYDVRFAPLYRALAKAGANIIAIPAAFVAATGAAHWHVLVRARAIETGCFVLAPAQCGEHDGGRRTFGHALIVNPWGEILAEAGDKPCVITATLDLSTVGDVRCRLPSLQHDREFQLA